MEKIDSYLFPEIVPILGSVCMLCKSRAPIQNSHIWPKFVVRWLKENRSPYFRKAENPNRRMEDVTKYPILCLNCETRFSVFEKQFCERVFKPFKMNPGMQSFRYGRWLSLFSISLSWRMLAVQLADFAMRDPRQAECAATAFEHWRKYLAGESIKINPYRHHLFLFTELDLSRSAVLKVPPNLHTYLHTSLDGDICSFDTRGVVFVLMPGMLFWSPLHPFDDKKWPKGSAIAEKGTFYAKQNVGDMRLGRLIEESARLANKNKLSSKQEAVVAKACRAQLENKTPEEISEILKHLEIDSKIEEIQRARASYDEMQGVETNPTEP